MYYRITGYYEKLDVCFIVDSNGAFEKLWEFSAYLIQKGIKILAAGDENKFLYGTLSKIRRNDKIALRAFQHGRALDTRYKDNNAILIGDKIYVPDRNK